VEWQRSCPSKWQGGIELKSIYNTVSLTFSAVLMCNPCAGWLRPTEQSGCTHAFVQGQ
jgi:hypothetical protein